MARKFVLRPVPGRDRLFFAPSGRIRARESAQAPRSLPGLCPGIPQIEALDLAERSRAAPALRPAPVFPARYDSTCAARWARYVLCRLYIVSRLSSASGFKSSRCAIAGQSQIASSAMSPK